jgi:hypothetical protein
VTTTVSSGAWARAADAPNTTDNNVHATAEAPRTDKNLDMDEIPRVASPPLA